VVFMMLAGAMEGIAGDLFFQMVVQGKRRGCLDGTEVAMAGIMGALSGGLGAPAAKVGSGRAYSVLFEMRMEMPNAVGEGTREFHNMLANEALARSIAADSKFAAGVRQLIPDIGSSGRMTGSPGAGWTWHHAPEIGVMQLVPTAQHTALGPIQTLLHPFPTAVGSTGGGGFQRWGSLF
jgi:hypothetical protein